MSIVLFRLDSKSLGLNQLVKTTSYSGKRDLLGCCIVSDLYRSFCNGSILPNRQMQMSLIAIKWQFHDIGQKHHCSFDKQQQTTNTSPPCLSIMNSSCTIWNVSIYSVDDSRFSLIIVCFHF